MKARQLPLIEETAVPAFLSHNRFLLMLLKIELRYNSKEKALKVPSKCGIQEVKINL